jgi:hypothetical protein
MKYILTERQYKILIEQPESRFGPEQYMNYAERRDFQSGNPGKAADALVSGSKKQMEFIHSIDPHTLMTIFAIGTAFIPLVGPFISAGIGMVDAAVYYKEGDTKTAGITAALSMLPFIGSVVSKIPGVKQLGAKGMAALASKLSKGTKLTQVELDVANAVGANDALIKQELTQASKKLSPLVRSIESLKPTFVSKFGQQKYEELFQQFISGKISKEGFLNNLKSASGETYKMAKMAVQSGIKFAKSELNQMSELASIIKQGGDRTLRLELIVNGTPREVEVYAMSFPGETFAGEAVGRDRIFMNLDKLVGKSEGEIRQILNHEATHIKDPSLVSPKLNKSYETIQNAKNTELTKYKDAYAKATETGKGADEVINAGKKYQDLYQQYLYHPQEIVANNQMILNNMTSEINGLIEKVGAKGAKNVLDNLVGYTSGKNALSQEALELLGDKGSQHLNGLYKYNKKYYQNFLSKIAKQSEYLKSQLNLLN